jgi:hypothetical protein
MTVLAGLLLLLGTSSGAAQDRHGFWFTGGLGYGSLGCDGCGTRFGGASGGIALGGTLSPKFLLGVGTTGYYRTDGPLTETLGTLDARILFYPSRTGNFYLTTGLGLGSWTDDYSGFGSVSETGVGFVLGLGYDIRVGRSVSLTPFWNGVGISTSSTNANLGQLGLNIAIHKYREPEAAKAASEPAPAPAPQYVSSTPRSADHQPPPAQPAPSEPVPVAGGADSASAPVVDVGRTALPPGTNYVGDVRLKLYYPIGCAAQHAIPPQFQVFFQSEGGAMQDGFKPSGDC